MKAVKERLVPHSCPVCLSAQVVFDTSFDSVRLYRCHNCDHCYTDTSQLSGREAYGPEYFLEVHKNWFENPDFAQFELLRQRIEGISKQAAVIDVGCGTGNLLRYLSAKSPNLKLTGLDLIENTQATTIEYICCDFLTTDMGRQFDFVATLHTIEHIEDLDLFMGRLKDVCRTGGQIAITTINERSLLYRTARLLRGLGIAFVFERIYGIHHLNHFNFSSLRRLCERSGLEVVKVIGSNIRIESVDIASRNPVLKPILAFGVSVLFWLGTLTGATYQQTVVCRKP